MAPRAAKKRAKKRGRTIISHNKPNPPAASSPHINSEKKLEKQSANDESILNRFNIEYENLNRGLLSVTSNWLSATLVNRLRTDAQELYKHGAFTVGALGGRGANYLQKKTRKCDCCGLFDDAPNANGIGDPEAREEMMDAISLLREELLTGYAIAEYMELQYLRYPGDGKGFYGKHVDQQGTNADSNNRILSILIYLNDESWDKIRDGGCFRAYPQSQSSFIEVEPRGGTLVVFNSQHLIHEAMPTNKERWALVGWFMCGKNEKMIPKSKKCRSK